MIFFSDKSLYRKGRFASSVKNHTSRFEQKIKSIEQACLSSNHSRYRIDYQLEVIFYNSITSNILRNELRY